MNLYVVASAVAFWFAALAGGFYWTRRYVRALESQRGDHERLQALERRIAELEASRAGLPAGEGEPVAGRALGQRPHEDPAPPALGDGSR